jgi:8-oxo-dGTP diphosphatase
VPDTSSIPRPQIDWTTWVPQMTATLLFIFRGDEVLLIRKKRGLGAGKMNGPGGKIEPDETPAQCAVREAREELRIHAENVEEFGLLRFQFTDGLGLLCHVFRSDSFTGEPVETDEAVPHWTPLDAIPYDEMWEDDRHWFPLLAARTPFVGNFEFDGDLMLSGEVLVKPPAD